jgi:integrase
VPRRPAVGAFIECTPKSGKSRRVDLSIQLTGILKALLPTRKREALRRGWKEMPRWVFVNEAGNALGPDNFRNRVWPKLLSKAGLRRYASTICGTRTPRC